MHHALPQRAPLALLMLLYLFSFGCAAGPAEAAADDAPIVQSLSWWMDESGQADLGTVQAVTDWTPFTGWKSFGFGQEPVWIRLRLRAGTGGSLTPWIVRIRPAFLDQLVLHDPEAGLTWRGGDTQLMDDDALGSITFTFRVPALDRPRDLYLRLESTSARAINIEVTPLNEAKHQVRLQEWLFGFATSLCFMFGLWAMAQWWQSRERVIGAFAVKQLFATLWAFFTLGFARVIFDSVAAPRVVSSINNTVLAGVIVTVLWFMRSLFLEYRPKPCWIAVMDGLCLLAPAVLLLQLFGLHWQSVMILNALVPITVLVLVSTLATAKGSPDKPAIPRSALLAYLFLYVALNMVPPLTYLGVLIENPAVDFGNLAYLLMDGLVMLIILQVRANSLTKRQLEVEKALVVSEEQVRLERQYREDQGQLLAMLAHEVKTPLATMRMWMDASPLNRDAMERAIADMNRVIERCVQTGQLSDRGLQPVLQRLDAGQLTCSVIQACRGPERVDLQLPAEAALLCSDAQMLSIVLANLLDNALKYGARGSRIRVNLHAAPNEAGKPGWCLEVCNAVGPSGFPEADKVFDKYYRSKQASRQSGSGLGLFLVKNLLSLLGGHILYLPSDEAVVFRVWLPA